jgi:hypothetical protein
MRFLIAILFVLPSCTSKEKEFKRDLTAGRCDEALMNLPQRDSMVKLADKSGQAAGTVLSYAFVGASYTAEVLLDAAGGTIMFVALCGVPLALLTAAAIASSSDAGLDVSGGDFGCFPGKLNALASPPLGRQAVNSTQRMRCPNVKSLSRSLRSVAACYEARGGIDNLYKANANLTAVQNSKDFFLCLPKEEKELLQRQQQSVISKLAQ